jgi:AcrR family transcriptional regulator
MSSLSSNAVRVAPQQERSTCRLASFLDAAAELFVEVGFEAATMTAVAERSSSSIGALYNYFPDKQSIAFTLVNQYSQGVEAHWKPLVEQAEILTHAEFADRFIERITQFVQERPAYLILLVAPTQVINATEYRNVSLSLLSESKTNPRRIFEDAALKELAESIRTQGVLSPLLVRPVTENGFEIVAGARRYRAAQMAEQGTVPVRIATSPMLKP